MARTAMLALISLLALSCFTLIVEGQAPAPGPDCNQALIQLFPCLDFLTNSSVNTAGVICCDALKNVSTQTPACLCELISPGNSNQTAGLGVNNTRALELPSQCGLNISPASCASIIGGPTAAPVSPPANAPAFSPVAVSPTPNVFSPAPFISAPPPQIFSPEPAVPAPGVSPVASPESIPPAAGPSSEVTPAPGADCSTEIASLTVCAAYLTDASTDPSSDCCTSLGHVVNTAPTCLCSIVTAGSTPAFAGLNTTRILTLPDKCNLSVNISECLPGGAVPPAGEGPVGSPSGNNDNGANPGASLSVVMVIALSVVSFAVSTLQ